MKKYFEYKELIKNYGIIKIFGAGAKEIYRKIWLEFIKNSYSQNGEDLIVGKIFDKKHKGEYMEIGAYHPTRLSNTYRFYKKGWRGIVIEPNPEVKKIFGKVRPRDKFINTGISDKNGVMDYYQFLIPALNTFLKTEADKSLKKGHKLIGIEKIKVLPVTEVVKNNIDFLSIDTEGFDEIILKNWPWGKCKPRVICVESRSKNVKELLKSKNYFLYKKTLYNLIFLKN